MLYEVITERLVRGVAHLSGLIPGPDVELVVALETIDLDHLDSRVAHVEPGAVDSYNFV